MKKRPQDWTWEEKSRVVVESRRLKGEELGAFLRQEGLHEVELRGWEMTMREGFHPRGRRKPTRNAADVKRIKELEREQNRKEKALAEAAALLVPKKR